MVDPFEAVIGLEVHCQLQTRSKAFSTDAASFSAEPNVHVDPLSLGHPGTLPVFNKIAIEQAVKMGLATHSTIHQNSIFARKHYFYPDLPKGYQISQFDQPICTGGYVKIDGESDDAPQLKIGLTRIHVEEDAGKSIHDATTEWTQLDYNRSGVPLIEIVSQPDIRTPQQAYRTMRKIRQLVRYLGICDGNMEEGSLRCDANVSIRRVGDPELGEKVEIKNLNSFRFLEKALSYEIERQTNRVLRRETIVSETRLWDPDSGETRSMRTKEEAHDYRYFPDPDLPPLVVSDEELEMIRSEMPALPDQRVERYTTEWGLPSYDAQVLTADREVADYFEACMSELISESRHDLKDVAKTASNFLMTQVLRHVRAEETEDFVFHVQPDRFAGLLMLRLDNLVSSTAAVSIFEQMMDSSDAADRIAQEQNLYQTRDIEAIDEVIDSVLLEHPDSVAAYRGGKKGLVGFFIGKVLSGYPGTPDPTVVRTRLEMKLEPPA